MLARDPGNADALAEALFNYTLDALPDHEQYKFIVEVRGLAQPR
jgi:hypothetical protein